MKKNLLLLISFLIATTLSLSARERGVALVVDSESYQKCRGSIESYREVIEEGGQSVYLIEERWGVPDSIRAQLHQLWSKGLIEGAVLIGDIPVAMIRNGQHLTTAFKMDQKREWNRSSVPSDRFYDDFSLQFDFIKRDSIESSYFYYNLSPKGAQRVSSDLYSARIKPPKKEGKIDYQLLDNYLNKVVRERRRARKIEQITYFAGHGYNSNSMVARGDERLALTAQFNTLSNGQGKISYIDYTFDDYVKWRLLAQLTNKEIDLAILHHHGADDAQLLSGSPYTNMAAQWIEMSKKFFRGKIRGSRDTTAAKEYYIENYNVPHSWVEGAFDPKLVEEDSLKDAATDIVIADLKGFNPSPSFVMLDACFNGSFHLDDYIAAHYIFNEGRTVVVKANSVNTLQDIWSNQLIGLLDLGLSVGNWAKEQFTLESHLIGDPTYRYSSSMEGMGALNSAVATPTTKAKFWKKLLKSDNAELEALALKRLYTMGAIEGEKLLEIQSNHIKPTVRLMAFTLLNREYNPLMVPSIARGMDDSYELLRRLATIKAQKNGSPQFTDKIIEMRISPASSMRIAFQAKRASEILPKELALKAYDRGLEGKEGEWYRSKLEERRALERTLNSTEREIKELLESTTPSKNSRFTISALRNSNNSLYLDILFTFMTQSKEREIRVALADALGWYTSSWRRDEIIEFCKKQIEIEGDREVKEELERTLSRLTK